MELRSASRVRRVVAAILVLALGGGIFHLWPRATTIAVTGYFSSAVGLYVGDDVKVAGVRIGSIKSISPEPEHTKIVMGVRGDVPIPADAQAIIISPSLVASRFIELTPTYDQGPILADHSTIPQARTAVPVEWDEIKNELTKLSTQLAPQPGSLQGPVTKLVNQAADTFDSQGDTFRQAVRELSQAAGRLGDSRTDLVGTIKNLRIVVDALSQSNEQIVQFANHVAAVSQVLADSSSDLTGALDALNHALGDVRGFLKDTNDPLVAQINKLASFTKLLNDHGDELEQTLHVAPTGLANFYNIYDPAQGSMSGLVTLPNFANPVQFICGTFETAGTPDYFRRAEICRERIGPVVRRLAVNYPPFLFHPINSINAYKGQIIYDTPETEAKARTPIAQLQWQPLPGVTPPSFSPETNLKDLLVPPAAGPPAHAGRAPAQPQPPVAGPPPNAGPAPGAPAQPTTPARDLPGAPLPVTDLPIPTDDGGR
ncbi:MCE family protein [Mycobacterium sp. 852002-51971_SCH5477799-a]|uniref:MCE family protein n=1 Tax=Mycobacterium sp. 852002-51971_SCH5477799-a TaxID=1834106 RepID=UPI0009ECE6F8|nr:MCE family protein [Mycobacterium sp. 852002-51971_SCH5477799-a]